MAELQILQASELEQHADMLEDLPLQAGGGPQDSDRGGDDEGDGDQEPPEKTVDPDRGGDDEGDGDQEPPEKTVDPDRGN